MGLFWHINDFPNVYEFEPDHTTLAHLSHMVYKLSTTKGYRLYTNCTKYVFYIPFDQYTSFVVNIECHRLISLYHCTKSERCNYYV